MIIIIYGTGITLNSHLPCLYLFFYRQENLAAQLAKIELAQQKRDEKAAEKAAKVLEVWFAILLFLFRNFCPGLRTEVTSLLNSGSFHFVEEIYTEVWRSRLQHTYSFIISS
jgi:hypothetical protein